MGENEWTELLESAIGMGIAATAIANEYGYDAQSRQCIEEMAELTQAINKFWRKKLECGKLRLEDIDLNGKEYDNLVEEIADVLIMLIQMCHFMDCGNEMVRGMNNKIERQINRIWAKRNQEIINGKEPQAIEHAE